MHDNSLLKPSMAGGAPAGGWWRRWIWGAVLAIGVLAQLNNAAWAEEAIDADLERRIKAVFIYRFPEFIDWPERAAAPAGQPFVISVIGACHIADDLRAVAAERGIQKRAVVVQQAQKDVAPDADLVFICDSERGRLGSLIPSIPSDALIVTESRGALSQGSIINFVLDDFRVRFEVALDGAKRRGFKLSPRLLDVALAVRAGS